MSNGHTSVPVKNIDSDANRSLLRNNLAVGKRWLRCSSQRCTVAGDRKSALNYYPNSTTKNYPVSYQAAYKKNATEPTTSATMSSQPLSPRIRGSCVALLEQSSKLRATPVTSRTIHHSLKHIPATFQRSRLRSATAPPSPDLPLPSNPQRSRPPAERQELLIIGSSQTCCACAVICPHRVVLLDLLQ